MFEKVYNSAEQKAAAAGKGAIFQRAAKTSIVYSRALDTPRGPSPWLRLQHKVADVLVLHRLRNALGGQARWAISGGAPARRAARATSTAASASTCSRATA